MRRARRAVPAAEALSAALVCRPGEGRGRAARVHPPLVVLTTAVLGFLVARLPARQRPKARKRLVAALLALMCAAFSAA